MKSLCIYSQCTDRRRAMTLDGNSIPPCQNFHPDFRQAGGFQDKKFSGLPFSKPFFFFFQAGVTFRPGFLQAAFCFILVLFRACPHLQAFMHCNAAKGTPETDSRQCTTGTQTNKLIKSLVTHNVDYMRISWWGSDMKNPLWGSHVKDGIVGFIRENLYCGLICEEPCCGAQM